MCICLGNSIHNVLRFVQKATFFKIIHMLNLKVHETRVSNSYTKLHKIINVVKEANKDINKNLKNFPKRLVSFQNKVDILEK